MKFVYPDIDWVFDTENEKINTLVIENPPLLLSLLTDIQTQTEGLDGRAVLSDNNRILPISKNLELLDRFVPFDLNTKSLVTKINAELEKRAVSDDRYAETNELLGSIDSFLQRLSFDFSCNIDFTKVNIGTLIRSSGVEICDDYDSLPEKIIDYFELVNEFLGRKLFITLNFRSFVRDAETELFMKTCLNHGFDLLMIENRDCERLKYENRLIVDKDLCII